MSKIGYKEEAIIKTLEDVFIQKIKVRCVNKRVVNGSFQGSGKLSLGQTLDLATKDVLNTQIQAGHSRCFYDGGKYLIIGIFSHDTKPIKQRTRKECEFIISLQ